MQKPKFSFIIPTRNEAAYLEECIKSIKAQTRGDYEIIVVDTLSNDKTHEIAGMHAKLLHEPRKGIGLARNTGAEHAKGEILIFADAPESKNINLGKGRDVFLLHQTDM